MSVTVSPMSRLEQALAITKINDLEFQGVRPLSKPSPKSRGVYGGNLCGQAILVAMQTVDADFVPHSLHSYFIAAGDDTQVCTYKVEKLSSGKNFANRLVRLYQDDKLKYIIMISLSKRNSLQKAHHNHEKGAGPRPFEYQVPPGEPFHKTNPDDLPIYRQDPTGILEQRLTNEFMEINEAEELKKTPGERQLSFYIKAKDSELPTPYKYASMGLITDSLYLTSVSRILHLPGSSKSKPLGASGGNNENFFSVSLDHSIYFHDDDFTPTNWLYFQYSSPRFSNNRVLFTGGYYNTKGKLVATIVQEGLLFFKNDADLKAKL